MSENLAALRFWELIDRATEIDGARAIHLAVGKQPMVRIEEGELQPLHADLAPLTFKSIQWLLSQVVEPERWARLEAVGEGELALNQGPGRRLVITVFRSSSAWSAVVHL